MCELLTLKKTDITNRYNSSEIVKIRQQYSIREVYPLRNQKLRINLR